MKIEDLTPEQKERAKGLKTPEEILEFVKAEGLELDDEQLDEIAGGKIGNKFFWEKWSERPIRTNRMIPGMPSGGATQ